ncbi:MAG: FAD-dependent oxidoreductase, partial [Clostridia bacterium]|nr:FAD-dependent oxidoreductase [Clostridia bacterium]
GDVDVLVCGGGPAGIGAAIRAAREGVSVMVVELQDCLGGIATAGMMSHWGGRSSSKIMQEMFDLTYDKAQEVGWCNDDRCGKNAIHHEVQKVVLEEMMLKENIKILYYTRVCKAIVENDTIVGVIVENKSGRGFIKAKRVVDATGDGDVAASAGVPYFLGRESDKRMQPCTIMFKVGGVDFDRALFPPSFETHIDTEKGEIQALAKELLPFPAGHVLLYPSPTPNTVVCNMTNAIEIDGTDGESLTKGVMTCRSQIIPIVKFLREYIPGYEKCWLMSSASLIGIRETRHFEGIESLSKDDILEAKVYDNWVVRRAWFNFDVHNLTGASLDKTGVQHGWKQKKDYTIPYGCLLPKKIEGLLLSGRNISGSHLAHSNFRIMSVCIALGEAAGVAAALSVKQNKKLIDVDVKEIQNIVGE